MPSKTATKVQADEEERKLTKNLMDNMELKKLLREERMTRTASHKDVFMSKQQKVIEILNKEKENLLNDLTVMNSDRWCVVDAMQSKEITSLVGQGDSLDRDIAQEKKYIEDLEAQIYRTSSDMEYYRKKMKSSAAVGEIRLQEENQRANRLMESLKSKLHAENVQLNVTIKGNAELREKIKVLLKSKANFNQLFEELVHKLKNGKRVVKDVVEMSTAQFKKRDEVQRKIEALVERDEADLLKRQGEMQDLEMKLTEDTVLARYKHRVMMVREKLSEGAKATKKVTLNRAAREHQLKNLQNTWETVMEKTGLFEREDICDLLVKHDAENYSLFCYNNELRYQLEVVTEQTTELMKKVEEEQEIAFDQTDYHHRNRNELSQQLHNIEETVNYTNESYDAKNRLFERLLSKLKNLFTMTKCDRWALDLLLGDNEDITAFNYRLYLDLLETKLLSLLNLLPSDRDVQKANMEKMILQISSYRVTTDKPSGSPEIVDRKVITRPCLECNSERAVYPSD